MYTENYKDLEPKIHPTARLFKNVVISGDITISKNVNIWFNASLRADMAPIFIGENTNIQDNAVVHWLECYPVFLATVVVRDQAFPPTTGPVGK